MALRSPIVRVLMVAVAVSGTTTFAAPVLAFDYVEHSRITQAGIELFLDSGSRPDGSPPRLVNRSSTNQGVTWLMSLRDGLASTRACEGDAFLSFAPPGCLSASDIPALAGDHAATPLSLKWRWFNDAMKPQDPLPPFEVGLRLLGGFAAGSRAPDEADVVTVDFTGFLRFVRRHQSRPWPIIPACREGAWDPALGHGQMSACARDDDYPSDAEFMRFDSSYGALAERGHAHFRPSTCAWSAPLPGDGTPAYLRRRVNRTSPASNAFAWYADLHTGARTLRQYAQAQRGAESIALWNRASLILEFYALHFLEDMVAAGHMQANTDSVTNTLLSVIHDEANRDGVMVKAPQRDLCRYAEVGEGGKSGAIKLPELHRACLAAKPVRIHGDHYLEQQGMGDSSARLTFEWASALVAMSLADVYGVTGPVDEYFSLRPETHFPRDGRMPWRTVSDRIGLDARASNAFENSGTDLPAYLSVAAWAVEPLSRTKPARNVDVVERASASLGTILNSVPMPTTLDGQACSNYERVNESFVQTDFGGLFAEVATGGALDLDSGRAAIRFRPSVGLAIPPRMLPGQMMIGAQVGFARELVGGQIFIQYRQFFGVDFGLFATGQIGGGARLDRGNFDPGVAWALGAGYLCRRHQHQAGVELLAGFDPVSRMALGLQFVAATAR